LVHCVPKTSRSEYCGGMDWVQDMTARWVRIMSAADSGRTPVDEAVRQISAIADTPAKEGRPGLFRRNSPAAEDTSAVTVLSRQLIAGVLVSDIAIARLCALENRSREQVLAELTADAPEQPLPFSHKTHAGTMKVACKMCHTNPDPGETGRAALGPGRRFARRRNAGRGPSPE